MVPAAVGRGLPQRWQLRSPGGLATPQAGLVQRLGGPSGSETEPSPCSRKPQSMQAIAPAKRTEPHDGQFWPDAGPLPRGGTAGKLMDGRLMTELEEVLVDAPAATGCCAAPPGTMNGF